MILVSEIIESVLFWFGLASHFWFLL